MLTFKQFNESKNDSIIFTFGRFNPPTTGHEKLINKIKKLSKSKRFEVFMSHTQDKKKNPLSFEEKLKFMKQGFKGIEFVNDKSLNDPFKVLAFLNREGWKNVTMVVGSDRVEQFRKSVAPYLGGGNPSLQLDFENFEVVSAGERDPDADDVSGMSASKLRELAKMGDLEIFKKGVPKGINAEQLMKTLQIRMK